MRIDTDRIKKWLVILVPTLIMFLAPLEKTMNDIYDYTHPEEVVYQEPTLYETYVGAVEFIHGDAGSQILDEENIRYDIALTIIFPLGTFIFLTYVFRDW